MPSYLVQCSYSSAALAALIANPHDRSEHVKKVAKKLGGKILGSWLSFGEHDLVMIVEMPDNVSVASLALAAAAGGSLKSVKTTPLMSIADGLAALKKAELRATADRRQVSVTSAGELRAAEIALLESAHRTSSHAGAIAARTRSSASCAAHSRTRWRSPRKVRSIASVALRVSDGDVDQADGLVFGGAGGAGDSGDSESDGCAGALADAFGESLGHFSGDGAVLGDEFGGHAGE